MAAEKAASLPLLAAEKAVSLPLSAVFVEEEEENKQQHAPADPRFLPGVRDVVMWALFHAGCTTASIPFALIVASISYPDPPSWLLRRDAAEPTDAEVKAGLMAAMLWCVCVLSQAATGAMALALPRKEGRRRLLLAYAALVATTAGHCFWAGGYIMLVARKALSVWNGVNTMVFIFFFVGDLLCFRGLVLRSVEGRSREDSSLVGKEVEPGVP